jgi:hypothetical protein
MDGASEATEQRSDHTKGEPWCNRKTLYGVSVLSFVLIETHLRRRLIPAAFVAH